MRPQLSTSPLYPCAPDPPPPLATSSSHSILLPPPGTVLPRPQGLRAQAHPCPFLAPGVLAFPCCPQPRPLPRSCPPARGCNPASTTRTNTLRALGRRARISKPHSKAASLLAMKAGWRLLGPLLCGLRARPGRQPDLCPRRLNRTPGSRTEADTAPRTTGSSPSQCPQHDWSRRLRCRGSGERLCLIVPIKYWFKLYHKCIVEPGSSTPHRLQRGGARPHGLAAGADQAGTRPHGQFFQTRRPARGLGGASATATNNPAWLRRAGGGAFGSAPSPPPSGSAPSGQAPLAPPAPLGLGPASPPLRGSRVPPRPFCPSPRSILCLYAD